MINRRGFFAIAAAGATSALAAAQEPLLEHLARLRLVAAQCGLFQHEQRRGLAQVAARQPRAPLTGLEREPG